MSMKISRREGVEGEAAEETVGHQERRAMSKLVAAMANCIPTAISSKKFAVFRSDGEAEKFTRLSEVAQTLKGVSSGNGRSE
jgi:hypothetical protein